MGASAFVAHGCGWAVRSIAARKRGSSRWTLPNIFRYGELPARSRDRRLVSDFGDHVSGGRRRIAISYPVAPEPEWLYAVPRKLFRWVFWRKTGTAGHGSAWANRSGIPTHTIFLT